MTSSILQISGKFSLTLKYDPNVIDYTMNAGGRSFFVVGSPASFSQDYCLTCDTGTVAVSGADAAIDVAAGAPLAYEMTVPSGAVSVAGSTASLLYSQIMQADSGSASVVGSVIDELDVSASPGSVGVIGSSVIFDQGYVMLATSGSVSIVGSTAEVDTPDRISVPAGSVSVTGSAVTFQQNHVLAASSGTVSLTGSVTDLQYTHASFTGPTGDITDWMISLTDTSFGATSWYWEAIHGTLGVVATSTDQHPTFDVRPYGRDNYDVTLAINGIVGSDATGSFNVIASGDDIYIGAATIAATWSGAGQRITFPIDRALTDAGAGVPLAGSLTFRIFSIDPVVEIDNRIALWGDDPGSDWTDSLGFVWGGSITDGGSISFEADVLDRDAVGYRVQISTGTGNHQQETYVFQDAIIYPHPDGGIGDGVIRIVDNVTNMVYTWAEVEKYDWAQFIDLSYALGSYVDVQLAKVATVQSHGVKVFNLSRPDLFLYGSAAPDSFPIVAAGVPYLWQNLTQLPTVSMMAQPLGLTLAGASDFRPWSDAIAVFDSNGYTQHPEDVLLTGVNDSLVKCPYRVVLNHTSKTWSTGGAARAKIDSTAWWDAWVAQQLACEGQRGVTLDGMMFSHVKINQRTNGSLTPRFVDDILRDGNPLTSWTSTNGTFDQPAEGLWRLAQGVNYGINKWVSTAPSSKPAVYDMEYLTADTWRSTSVKNSVRNDYISQNPGSTWQDADAAWFALTQDNIDKCQVIYCPQIAGNDIAPWDAEWLQLVRAARDAGKPVISQALKPVGQPQVL